MHTMMITPELLGLIPSNSGQNEDPGPSQQSSASMFIELIDNLKYLCIPIKIIEQTFLL